MSIQSEIEDLQENLRATQAAIAQRGGTVSGTGFSGLAESVETIPEGEPTVPESDWGIIQYYSKTVENYQPGEMTQGCVINSVDGVKLNEFCELNQIDSSYGVNGDYSDGDWRFFGMQGEVTVPDADMLATTGIDVTVVDQWASFELRKTENPDITSEVLNAEIADATEAASIRFSPNCTIGGVEIKGRAVKRFVVGHYLTAIPSYMFESTSIEGVDGTYADSLASIGDNSFSSVDRFVEEINLPNVTSIGQRFLSGAQSFNASITMPNLVGVGSEFLLDCSSYNQPIIFPKLASTGNSFLTQCSAFNQPIAFSTQLSSIGKNFLSSCTSFNFPVNLPAGITSIPDSFLAGCSSFNQPFLIPSSVTRIGGSFLMGCSSFNQKILLPSGLTQIGDYYLAGCSSYNQETIIPDGVSIGFGFLSSCSGLNSDITLPKNLVISNAINFLNKLDSMTATINVQNATISDESNSMLCATSNTAPAYTTGITLKGANRTVWMTKCPNGVISQWGVNCYRNLIDGGE